MNRRQAMVRRAVGSRGVAGQAALAGFEARVPAAHAGPPQRGTRA
jgi:hypothetical protein